jgi:hypothetical protein
LSVFLTDTFTVPDACAGVFAVIELLLTTLTFVAATPPTNTVAPALKPVPEILIDVPPLVGPLLGFTELTVGAGGGGTA